MNTGGDAAERLVPDSLKMCIRDRCQYLDELTGGRGVVFATGTPVSNSMAELYTMMRYLQYGMLQERGLTP